MIELQVIKQLVELPILLLLVKLDEELVEAVEGESLLVINIDLEGILHEFLADRSDFLGEGGAEHHDLLLCRCGAEDLLNVTTHV